MEQVKIAIVDDHTLFRRGIVNLIQSFKQNYSIEIEANSGDDFLKKIVKHPLPDIAIIDISMPGMNGFELVQHIRKEFPEIKVLVITMIQDEYALIKMLKFGVRGYLSKDIEPEDLQEAIRTIIMKGYYFTDYLTGKLINAIQNSKAENELNEREMRFMQLCCSEYTYKEIADIMCLSIKTVDGYRNNLFEKFAVKSRVGLVLFAIKNHFLTLDDIKIRIK